MLPSKQLNILTRQIIGCAIEVQKNLGLLINFNVLILKDGIRRKINQLPARPIKNSSVSSAASVSSALKLLSGPINSERTKL